MGAQDRYEQPFAYRRAVEDRLRKDVARTGRPLNRARQLFLFERLLARAFNAFGDRLVLKGGLALELRVARARTTKDVDLRLVGSTDDLLTKLQHAGRLDVGDWLTFLVVPDPEHPVIEGEGAFYSGQRFRARAELGGSRYGDPFGLDLGVADVLVEPPEVIPGSSFLEFIGVPTPTLRVYPRTSHVSEKLHAYTLPRERPNSRVKDLPDLALLASTGTFEAAALLRALNATFDFRKTHALPPSLPQPLDAWTAPYARMAKVDSLPWASLPEVFAYARAFLDPILAQTAAGVWDPQGNRWIVG